MPSLFCSSSHFKCRTLQCCDCQPECCYPIPWYPSLCSRYSVLNWVRMLFVFPHTYRLGCRYVLYSEYLSWSISSTYQNISIANMTNAAGNVVSPGITSFQSAMVYVTNESARCLLSLIYNQGRPIPVRNESHWHAAERPRPSIMAHRFVRLCAYQEQDQLKLQPGSNLLHPAPVDSLLQTRDMLNFLTWTQTATEAEQIAQYLGFALTPAPVRAKLLLAMAGVTCNGKQVHSVGYKIFPH